MGEGKPERLCRLADFERTAEKQPFSCFICAAVVSMICISRYRSAFL
jgi:hypothetical protein